MDISWQKDTISGIISCFNPFESKTVLYFTIRSCTIRTVQFKTVFDPKGLEQDIFERSNIVLSELPNFDVSSKNY
jgi:hypothetical protein